MHIPSPVAFTVSFILLVFLDQGTKYLASSVVINTGVSFGLFSSSLLTLGLVGILISIAILWGKVISVQSPVAAGVFFGGAVSNIVDRLFYGGVRDFLSVPVLNVRNNIADWAIILALFWLFFSGGYNTPKGER